MPSLTKSRKSGTRGEPEKTRAAILQAAFEAFAHEGAAGARTDEIARQAGVNKALLYYYFKDKEGLYAAVMEQVFQGLFSKVLSVLERHDLNPQARLLLYARTHFDYIASSPLFPRLVQREFMRARHNAPSIMSRIFERHGRPVYTALMKLMAEGMKAGEFRKTDPAQTLTSILGIVVFYFISVPAQRMMTTGNPFSSERIAERRAAVLDFISAAVFTHTAAPRGKSK